MTFRADAEKSLLVDPNETVIVTLSSGGPFTVGTSNSATVTIADSPVPVITVSATDATAKERPPASSPDWGAFTISRTGTTMNALAVSYALTGSATNGADYVTLSGTAMIQAGPGRRSTCNLSPKRTLKRLRRRS